MIDLTERVGAVAQPSLLPAVIDPVVVDEPTPVIARQERRAVGRGLRLLSHVLDAAALGLPILVYSYFNSAIPNKASVLFVVVGTLMLWPTHRRGRHVVAPSEGLVSVITRIGMAPVITSAIVSVVGVTTSTNSQLVVGVGVILQIVVFTLPLVLLSRLISVRLAATAR
ncbi:MAG TPA: hypothetical protein PLS63_10320, partial [Microthrixaceae bacterium]|nr:hypothetical protein [Microthrixaceae bacterium]